MRIAGATTVARAEEPGHGAHEGYDTVLVDGRLAWKCCAAEARGGRGGLPRAVAPSRSRSVKSGASASHLGALGSSRRIAAQATRRFSCRWCRGSRRPWRA